MSCLMSCFIEKTLPVVMEIHPTAIYYDPLDPFYKELYFNSTFDHDQSFP